MILSLLFPWHSEVLINNEITTTVIYLDNFKLKINYSIIFEKHKNNTKIHNYITETSKFILHSAC